MSPELLSSKISVEEEQPRVRRIAGVPTAVKGMVGVCEWGPVGEETLTTSPEEWNRIFGGYTADADAALAADGYYENGGRALWTVRTVHYNPDATDPTNRTSAAATLEIVDRAPVTPIATLQIDGKYEGVRGNNFKIVIAEATSGDADQFNLEVEESGVIVEVWPNLSMTDADTNFVETVINDPATGSNLIKATDLDSGTTTPGDLPEIGTAGPLTGGDDGLTGIADADYIGDAAGQTGIRALDPVQDLSLLAVPGQATSAVHNAMITYGEVTRQLSVFPILDPPAGATAAEMVTYVVTTASLYELSEFGAIYWPQIKVVNPSKTVFGIDDTITVAPSGAIAGLMARNGTRRGGVHEPPAGIEFGKLFGVVGLETDEVKDEGKRDLVFPKNINPIVSYPGAPIHLDGARCLKSTGNFPTVGERRGAIFIEQSIKAGILFAKQRRNTEKLRGEVDRSVESFLLIQLKEGAFVSDVPSEAYFLDFDVPGVSLNSPAVQFARQLKGRIGIATAKPAEYIILLFSQDTRALEQQLASL